MSSAPHSGIINKQSSQARAVANTLKGSLGNLVEWYDVYVYTVFLKYFEPSFFGAAEKKSTLYAYAIFALTFVMRPVGSWFFGRYADRYGRRAALTFSVSLMAGCSLLIGLMPTREVIGIWAVIALMVLRIVQGFATGGEYGTSATYMSEAATEGRRGFFSSFQYVTLVAGQVLAQALLLLMLAVSDKEFISTWGWRIAYIIGGLGAVVVLYLRRTMEESLSDEHLDRIRSGEDKRSGTLRELFGVYWRETLLVFLLTAGGTLCFYVYTVVSPAIVKDTFSGDQAIVATTVNLSALVILMLIQPLGGLISDKVGRKNTYMFFCFGALFYTWVLIKVLPQQASAWAMFALMLFGFIILTGYTSINAIIKAEQFPAHIRALGLGLSYALANSAFGGTAPLVHDWMGSDGDTTKFTIYVTVIIAVTTFTTVFFLRDRSLDEPELNQVQPGSESAS